MTQRRIPTITRFLAKVERSSPTACWPWTGGKDEDGYGIFWDGTYRPSGRGRYVRAHRWGYERFVGPIPEGLNLCHTCDNPPCCNPAHLFPGTHADNHADREAKGRGGQWMTRGERHVNHKLTAPQVTEIRTRRAAGESAQHLAREFGVSDALVYKIAKRKIWAHID